MDNCIFCKIVSDTSKSHIVYEDEKFLAFLDIFPINEGHTLIIPKNHTQFIWEMEESLYTEIFDIAKVVRHKLQSTFDSKTVALAIEGLSVPHTHIHLVPVYNMNELDPNRASKAPMDRLEQTLKRINST